MNDLLNELEEAVEELVAATIRLAWAPDVHGDTGDTLTVEAAADRLEQRLGE